MYIEETTPHAFETVVDHLSNQLPTNSRVGDTKEQWMVMIQSDDPRERWIDRPGINWAFGLQECFAYWNGMNPGYVQRYNSRMEQFMYDGKLHGSAYGRYLRKIPHDQLERVIETLNDNRQSRQAVITIHQPGVEDYDKGDVACTMDLQFVIRDDELHCTAHMRSQDMLWGYPYDTQAFQWIQEVLAGILGVDLGTYTHVLGSAHYYIDRQEKTLRAADEYEAYSLPDCRLEVGQLATVMRKLDSGLTKARDGQLPLAAIARLDLESRFYADWLRMMTVYEFGRFHDDLDIARQKMGDIEVDAFRKFVSG